MQNTFKTFYNHEILNESSPKLNSPEKRIFDFCMATKDNNYPNMSPFDDMFWIAKYIAKDLQEQKIELPITAENLTKVLIVNCQQLAKRYNEEYSSSSNFRKITSTKGFTADLCNLIWDNKDLILKIKRQQGA